MVDTLPGLVDDLCEASKMLHDQFHAVHMRENAAQGTVSKRESMPRCETGNSSIGPWTGA
jgi:hypothetical protein